MEEEADMLTPLAIVLPSCALDMTPMCSCFSTVPVSPALAMLLLALVSLYLG